MSGRQAWRRADLLAVSVTIGVDASVLETGSGLQEVIERTLTL
jgi:hypothetical protein